jgi:hypothetical protein
MKKTMFAAIAALALTGPALAESKIPLPKAKPVPMVKIAVGEIMPFAMVPGPGKAVDYNGYRCLMMSPHDHWTHCTDVGRVYVQPCRNPVLVKGEVIDRWVCLDQMSAQRDWR